jgi:hypothetical protein
MSRKISPKRQARRAIRNAVTRAAKHAEDGDFEQAYRTMCAGAATAEEWLDGTHPKLAPAS